MTKFTAEEKLTAVKRYLGRQRELWFYWSSHCTSKQVIADWVMQYQHHGVEELSKNPIQDTQQSLN